MAGEGPGWLASGPVDPQGPTWQPLWVHSTGCTQRFRQLEFKKDFKNEFSDSYLNALKNVCVLILAPNLLKQNLLGSLSPDLLGKIFACHFWDTFL